MKPLPKIMIAPNGARRTKADHQALPVTIQEIVDTAKACFAAGADGLHAHVRDAEQKHVLDAGLYRELIAELEIAVPQMDVQITTEAIGMYSPAQQRELVRAVMPKLVSVSLAEMTSDNDPNAASEFYHWAAEKGIAVQHILYSTEEFEMLAKHVRQKTIPSSHLQIIIVLGKYNKNQESQTSELIPFLKLLETAGQQIDWMVCAFGRSETECLTFAAEAGGKVRIGFENNFWNSNGVIAKNNAERVMDFFNTIK
ncbi:MAG: class III aminotransferase [Hyphomicrobiales bacterium]|nr:MAG: class III aminotransferase [Hyphomicrobiales bacterium]